MRSSPASPKAAAFALLALAFALLALEFVPPAIAADPPAVEQGVRLFELGKYDEARTALLPLGNAKPPDATAAFYLGRIALNADDAKQAERWFEAALARDGSNSNYHLWLGRAVGTQAQHVNKFAQLGLAKRTKKEFERAVELDPANLDAHDGLIDFYLGAPGILGGSIEKAKAEAGEIRKRDALRGGLTDARIAEDQKDAAGAEHHYQATVKAFPDSTRPRLALGQFYVRGQKYDEAFATFEEILRIKPGDASALYSIGRTGAISGQRLEGAQEALEQFLAMPPRENTPRPAGAHWRLGMIHEKRGNKDIAREEYRRALAIDPSFGEAKKSLAKLK